MTRPLTSPATSGHWPLQPVFSSGAILWAALVLALLAWTGWHVEIPRLLRETAGAAGQAAGVVEHSQVAQGFGGLLRQMWPPVLADVTPLERLPGLDRDHLPWLGRIERQEYFDVRIDYETLRQDITVRVEETLVVPFGYLFFVLHKMAETLEIGLWGTVLAVALSVPLAVLSARNYAPHRSCYLAARALVSFFRTVPELVSALFFVLAYGFGPGAGVLALGFHSAGFLGKFYAEDIENADRGPQEALTALGAGRLRVLRLAVLPQVLPQYIAYTLYILDRNIRMATIIGIVGAGGIGQELKGRWDIFHYSHVTTILLVLFLTVLALDQFSARLRARLIR